jgi:hypothetical protein
MIVDCRPKKKPLLHGSAVSPKPHEVEMGLKSYSKGKGRPRPLWVQVSNKQFQVKMRLVMECEHGFVRGLL